MLISCSRCRSEEVRLLRSHTFGLRLLRITGIYRFVCEDCGHRFLSGIWRIRYFAYAKCPRCQRMDLSSWRIEQYEPRTFTRWMVSLGAKPSRCEYCRYNFWSFRFIREQFCRIKRAGRSPVVIPARNVMASTQDSSGTMLSVTAPADDTGTGSSLCH